MGKRATSEPAYNLVQWVNQTGQLKRFRADRAIKIDPGLSPMERQKKEIERDLVNVRWLADVADHVSRLISEADAALVRAPVKQARAQAAADVRAGAEGKLWAVIPVDADYGGLGERRLSRPLWGGKNALQLTLERLARCTRLEGVVLACGDEAGARTIVGEPPAGLRVEFETWDGEAFRDRARAVGMGRLWARHCWRGGLANLACYDEAVWPAGVAPILTRRGLEGAVFVGADWVLVDPALVDAVIERHLSGQALAFVQAPPGLGACAAATRVMEELAAAASPVASIGGLIGYLPRAPQSDPIAKPACVTVDPCVRDLLVRCIPDSPERAEGLMKALPDGAREHSALQIARALAGLESPSFGVEHVSVYAAWVRSMAKLAALRWAGGEVALTIRQGSAPMSDVLRLVAAARECGFAGVHVRAPLAGGAEDAEALLEAGPDVISVDVLAESPETYKALTGRDGLETVRDGVTRLLEKRAYAGGMPRPWVVPRITRRDAVYEQIEDFYVRGLITAGACVIDPLPAPDGGRIEPLPLPANVRERLHASTWSVDADGVVRNGAGEVVEGWQLAARQPRPVG
jgi:hypothetical protein